MSDDAPDPVETGLEDLAHRIDDYLPPHRSVAELVEVLDTVDASETVPFDLSGRDLILLRYAIDLALETFSSPE